ncbi:unnamed protein product [Eruca vesicaria subsp. sativa]|uniref:Ubiquitin-like protease family profile domain-containing protein n=1 Tax=Eruca vesicaria subsp. sativa TaxID=29727 RepID=A0ABC8KVC2_ERUVS|nr:unnamed protein product [Eruca vesicaria subsp. sativa]
MFHRSLKSKSSSFNFSSSVFFKHQTKDVVYPYISWGGDYVVVEQAEFIREDEVEDDRINVLKQMIMNNHDFSGHIWEFEEDTTELSLELDDKEGEDDEVAQSEKVTKNGEEAESDEDFQTPKQSRHSDSSARKGKKRLPDRGMEKKKHKVLSARPQQAPLGEDMKTWMAQLFQQNIEAMEDRLQKQMAERFEKMQSELQGSLKVGGGQLDHGEASPRKSSPSKPSASKANTSMPSPSKPTLRRSERVDASLSEGVDMDFDAEIGTQSVEGLSQASFVPGFDPSQTNREDGTRDFWTPLTSLRPPVTVAKEGSSAPPPTRWEKWYKGGVKTLQLSDSPLPQDGSPESPLYYVAEDTWTRFSEWSMYPKTLQFGPTAFNMTIATRIIAAGKWLGNEKYQLPNFLLAYGRGELPAYGRTNKTWGVDVDKLYFPLFVNGNHWIAVCVNIIEKIVDVYDCFQGKNRQHVEKFAVMIPRIVKAVAPPEEKKHLLLEKYTIHDIPLKSRLNKSCADCGAYALKHLECLLLDLDLGLVDDEIIMGCRQKNAVDIWGATQDPI